MNVPLPPGWSARTLAGIRTKLLNWFDRHHRPLPWRSGSAPRDAYRIWVSEVMLQQTTVAAVVPYFERFVAAVPNVHALAAADEQRVLKLWEGLGYYRRARHLYAAAQDLVRSHGGILPDDPAVWAELPGVGRYILGAVLSQAFDRRLPIVEANSLRVLARLFGYRGDPRVGAGRVWVWAAAETLLPRNRCGDFNQGLMELGALVCTPAAPDCSRCPLAVQCEAHSCNLQREIPPKKHTPAITAVNEVAVIVRKGSHVLLCQRTADAGRWQNMWEVPHGPRGEAEPIDAAVVRVARELTGLEVAPKAESMTIHHRVTRYAISLVCVEAEQSGGVLARNAYADVRWVLLGDLAAYPVSAPQRKLMTALAASERPPRVRSALTGNSLPN